MFKLAALTAATVLISSCSSTPEAGSAEKVEMGVMLPFTGARADIANIVRRGMETAEAEINSQNPERRLSLVYADSSEGRSAEYLRAFEERGVKALHVGLGSESALCLEDVGKLEGTLVNFACAYPPAAVHVKNAVRIFPNAAEECEVMAKTVMASPDREKRIVIMSVDDLAGKSAGAYMKYETGSMGLKMFSDVYGDGEKNFDIFAEQIVRLNADYVMLLGYGDAEAPMLESLKNKGFEGVFAANCGPRRKDAGSSGKIAAYAVKTPFELGLDENPQRVRFAAKYREKFGEAPSWPAAYGYDGVMLLWRAMEKSGWNAEAARKSLLNSVQKGAAGNIKIDESGDSTSSLKLIRIPQ